MNEAEQPIRVSCKNCGAELLGPYCGQCGQKRLNTRWTVRQLLANLLETITNLERGLWYTAGALFRHPARVIGDYLRGATVRYAHPFRYLLFWTTISAVISIYFGLFDQQQSDIQELVNPSEMSEPAIRLQQAINERTKQMLNFAPLIIIPFISLLSYRLFRRRGGAYAEHLIANTFLYGHLVLIGIPLLLIMVLAPGLIPFSLPLSLALSITYYTYYYRDYYSLTVARALGGSFLTIIFGFVLMLLTVSIVGSLIAVLVVLLRR